MGLPRGKVGEERGQGMGAGVGLVTGAAIVNDLCL